MSCDQSLDEKQRLAALEDILVRTFGVGAFPLEMVGDLDDLGFAVRKALALLEYLLDTEQRRTAGAFLTEFKKLEFILREEIPPVLRDLDVAVRSIGTSE
jgi:hypothetical protein